jgi:cysteine desulfurase/selenocysteine lyase
MMKDNDISEWASIRSHFPGAEKHVYLDVSARSLLFEGGRLAMIEHLDALSSGVTDKAALFQAVEDTRNLLAMLICASAHEICFSRNVTDGIAAFGASIEWKPGDNVVLCEELEHPANVHPWYGLARKYNTTVTSVPAINGKLTIESILGAINARTRVVTLSAISFAPGFVFPVRELGIECRRRGILLLVDAAQAIGVANIDVREWHADAVVGSTQKGLMALYGLGFLYIRREVAETLKPIYLSRFGVEQQGHEAGLGNPLTDAYASGARRFDVGNYNYPAILTLAPAIRMLLEVGPSIVQDYVFNLARKFTAQVLDLGLPVFGGYPGMHSSHIVTVGVELGSEHDATADLDMLSLYEHLIAHNVKLSIRRNLLRFSFHIYNNDKDIDLVIGLISGWRAR